MRSPVTRIILKISLVTAGIVFLFEAANLLLLYKYFKFDYYLSAVAVVFLVAGYLISRHKYAFNTPITDHDPFSDLTAKEQQILQQIINGKSNKEIAAMNFVEVSTIKTHINNIYAKLGLNSRKEAINIYKTRFTEAYQSNIHPFST